MFDIKIYKDSIKSHKQFRSAYLEGHKDLKFCWFLLIHHKNVFLLFIDFEKHLHLCATENTSIGHKVLALGKDI